jgi:hypothetical protein
VAYLVHLKGRQNSLNQHGSSDSPPRNSDGVLGQVEDVVPESGLQVRLHLGEVEVRSMAILDELLGVVEKVQSEVEKTAGDGLAVNGEVLLLQVPSSRSRLRRALARCHMPALCPTSMHARRLLTAQSASATAGRF